MRGRCSAAIPAMWQFKRQPFDADAIAGNSSAPATSVHVAIQMHRHAAQLMALLTAQAYVAYAAHTNSKMALIHIAHLLPSKV